MKGYETYSTEMAFQGLTLIVGIIIAIATAKIIGQKVENKEEFSGTAWGLLNGLFGIGILWVILAHSSINTKIAQVKSKKYANYAKAQMKDFIKIYAICLIIWIVISLMMFAH